MVELDQFHLSPSQTDYKKVLQAESKVLVIDKIQEEAEAAFKALLGKVKDHSDSCWR